MRFAAQGHQYRRESSKTDRNLSDSQKGICNVVNDAPLLNSYGVATRR